MSKDWSKRFDEKFKIPGAYLGGTLWVKPEDVKDFILAERKRIVEEIVSHFEFMKQNEGKFRKNIKDGYGKAMVEETMDKVIKYLKSLEEENQ